MLLRPVPAVPRPDELVKLGAPGPKPGSKQKPAEEALSAGLDVRMTEADHRLVVQAAERLGLTRQWLHARTLAFAHPATREWVSFDSPDAPDLAHALAILRGEELE